VRTFPVVKKPDRAVTIRVAIALSKIDGFLPDPTVFEWLDWSNTQIRFQGGQINQRSVHYVNRAIVAIKAVRENLCL
jgi:hypothetical protein